MTFTYPAVFTPHADGKGYHAEFPDLEMCEVDGPDLEDTLDLARDAATDWISIELSEFDGDIPMSTHPDDVKIQEGQFVRNIMVHVKLLPDND